LKAIKNVASLLYQYGSIEPTQVSLAIDKFILNANPLPGFIQSFGSLGFRVVPPVYGGGITGEKNTEMEACEIIRVTNHEI
jgi:hypothetical protein